MIFATFNASGNCPVEIFMLMIVNKEGLTVSADFFRIFAVIPSSPVAFAVSREPIMESRSVFFIKGITNSTLRGTFVST